MATVESRGASGAAVGDWSLAARLWPLLVSGVLVTLPTTAISIFIVAVADNAGASVATVGGLRGLGGVAALCVGLLAAPLIDRLPRAWSVGGGLLALAVATLLAPVANLPALVVFNVVQGCAGGVLTPALQAASVDAVPGPAGQRAASLVASTVALSGAVSGLVLAGPALLWGWRAAFVVTAVVAAVMAAVALGRLSRRPPVGVARAGYLATFPLVRSAPGAVALLAASTLRAVAFFAWVVYLGAYFVERFGLEPAAISLVWLDAAGIAFLSTVLAGRWLDAGPAGGRRARWLPVAAAALAAVTGPAIFLTADLATALVVVGLFGVGTGSMIAATVGLLVQRHAPIRGAVLGLNGAAFNVGTFAGAALGGVALAAGGYPGLAAAVGGLGVLTVVGYAVAARSG